MAETPSPKIDIDQMVAQISASPPDSKTAPLMVEALRVTTDGRFSDSTDGRSTITLQVARNFAQSPEARPNRMMLLTTTFALGQRLPDQRILDFHADQVYFGRNCHGIDAAARAFFNTTPADLTIGQVATLAALPHSPDHTLDQPDRLNSYAGNILRLMRKRGVISKAEAESAVLPAITDTAGCAPG